MFYALDFDVSYKWIFLEFLDFFHELHHHMKYRFFAYLESSLFEFKYNIINIHIF